jgi:ABC-2 type transport system ATP-binding protein
MRQLKPHPTSEGETYAIETAELSRRFGDFLAVDRLNLRIRKGIVFGLLGPNGAVAQTSR